MRFMLFVYPGETDPGPTLERVEAMNRYNEQIARDLGVASEAPDLDAELDDHIGDDLLSLVFTCCHDRRLPCTGKDA